MRKWYWVWTLVIILTAALALAACGGDEEDTSSPDTADPTAENVSPENGDSGEGDQAGEGAIQFNPQLGPSIEVSAPGQLPGCSDPDDDACPLPLDLALDGEVTQNGVTISYPTRYFDVQTSDTDSTEALIAVVPAANYPFDEQARFSVYYAASIDAAVAALNDPESVEWETGQGYTGTIAVSRDDTLDPPEATIIGAFDLPNGQTIVLELETTGKYGWDLYTAVYTGMLDSLVVTDEEAPPAVE